MLIKQQTCERTCDKKCKRTAQPAVPALPPPLPQPQLHPPENLHVRAQIPHAIRERRSVVRQHARVDVIKLYEAGPLQVFGDEDGESGSGAGAEGEVGEGGAAAVQRGVLVAVEHGYRDDAAVGLVVEQAANNFVVLHVEQSEAAPLRGEGSAEAVVGENEYEALAAHNLHNLAPLAQKRKTQAHDFGIDNIESLADVHRPAKGCVTLEKTRKLGTRIKTGPCLTERNGSSHKRTRSSLAGRALLGLYCQPHQALASSRSFQLSAEVAVRPCGVF